MATHDTPHPIGTFAWGALLILFLTSCGFGNEGLLLENRPSTQLEIDGSVFRLWRACSPAEQRLGLKLADVERMQDAVSPLVVGMAFVYPGDRIAQFTMRDVPFDVNLALFDGGGYLRQVATLPADSEETFSWPEPVRYAIETGPGGWQGVTSLVGEKVLDDDMTSTLRRLCTLP